MKQTQPKWFSRMKPSELEDMAAKFDREIDYSETKRLTPAMRKEEQQARQKGRGRPQ